MKSSLQISELRKGKSTIKQSVIALQMAVQEPAVSKLEQKPVTQISIDKLSRYIEAIGGNIKIEITMPNGEVMHLESS